MATQAVSPQIETPLQTTLTRPPRLQSVDLLRGLVMAIMALDHTRDYFTWRAFPPEMLQNTYLALFFTRWITHFCAPVFFFLAGTGAYLSFSNGKSAAQLSNFLWKRGLWLIVLEQTVIWFGWSFLPFFPGVIALVIFTLGASMIFLAAIVRLPVKTIAGIGLGMIFFHNLLDPIHADNLGKWTGLVWALLHEQHFTAIATVNGLPRPVGVFVLYPLIPWLGVMASGYAFGAILRRPADARRRVVFRIGLAATALFVVLRGLHLYGNSHGAGYLPVSNGEFHAQSTLSLSVISFLNVQKYPPSLQYLLMTLGPALMVLAWMERLNMASAAGKLWSKLLVFGKVPMFYYILHLYLLHLLATAIALAFGQPWKPITFGGFMAGPIAPGYGHNLPFIYAVWISALVILYFPCRWYAEYKATHKEWWLSYI